MKSIGRRIFYDKITGNVLVDTGERRGLIVQTTIEQDIASHAVLQQRVRSTFSVIELSFGQFGQDFSSSSGYRVNPTTKKLEFSYATPSEPTAPPVVQPPLSEKVEELEALWLYDSMMKDMAIAESNVTQADMMYQLMLKGVL